MPKVIDDESGPFWQTDDGAVKFWLGDVIEQLRLIPARSVQCCVTSPPYWGLRDYGTADWEGGDPACDHSAAKVKGRADYGFSEACAKQGTNPAAGFSGWKQSCPCGARRIDRQIGSETTPQEFVNKMVAVFREVRRVLRDDGVLWLNLGDSYNVNTGAGFNGNAKRPPEARETKVRGNIGLASGNLVGIPWRVALALQADGWVLRSDVPWVKRSAMPESVQNRPAKALEYVFMFAKRPGYFFDMEAVRRQHSREWWTETVGQDGKIVDERGDGGNRQGNGTPAGRAFRNADLWFESVEKPHGLCWLEDEMVGLDVTSEAYSGSHFATFPSGLIRPLILASTSERGACAKCGAPWRRVVDHTPGVSVPTPKKAMIEKSQGGLMRTAMCANTIVPPSWATTGWRPSCECFGHRELKVFKVERQVSVERLGEDGSAGVRDRSLPQNRNGITGSLDGVPRGTETTLEQLWVYVGHVPEEEHPVVPCVVLDPFMGSGTTALVCLELGRRAVGIDLSEAYLREHAIRRVKVWLENRKPLESRKMSKPLGRIV